MGHPMKPLVCSRRDFLQLAGAAGLGLAWPQTVRAAGDGLTPPPLPSIEIEKGEWGDASLEDIQATLKSTARELWRHAGPTRMDAMRVQFRKAGPITIFQRAPDGKIRIGLAVSGQHWAQFAYQFAHEFVHALAAQSNDWKSKWHEPNHANHWLEESLAETGSLFAIRAMAKAWQTKPPYSNWKSFAPSLASYADERMVERAHQLPEGQPFAKWFAATLPELRKNPVQRAHNTIVARQLLPIFEREPSGWEAVTWLNLGKRDAKKSLERHLTEWKELCPEPRRKFVSTVAGEFGLKV